MDRTKRDLIKKVFHGAKGSNKLSYNELMEAHSLRSEVSKMSALKRKWIVGFSGLYSDTDLEAYDKQLNKAMLKEARSEYEALTSSSALQNLSLDDAIAGEQRINTLLRSGRHEMKDLSVLGSVVGSPERKINNAMRGIALNECDKLSSQIESKLKAGQSVKDDLQKLDGYAKFAVSRRSVWDTKVSKLCDRAVECQCKAAESKVSINPGANNIREAAQQLEAVQRSSYGKYASREERKEITKTLTHVKSAAINAIDAELNKPNPDPKLIKEYAKTFKDSKALRKTLEGNDREILGRAAERVKELENPKTKAQPAKAAPQGTPSTFMGDLGNALTSLIRGPQQGFAMGVKP